VRRAVRGTEFDCTAGVALNQNYARGHEPLSALQGGEGGAQLQGWEGEVGGSKKTSRIVKNKILLRYRIDQTRLALAALTACLVKTLSEQDESFQSRFTENLDRIYKDVRDSELPHIGAMETLGWTGEFLKKL
jgi:hypothetical protein